MSHDQKPGPRFRVVQPRVFQYEAHLRRPRRNGAPAPKWFGRLIEVSNGDYSEFGPFDTRKEAARELVNLYDPENVDAYMGDEEENFESMVHEDQAAWYEWAACECVLDEFSDEFVEKFSSARK